MSDNYQPIYDAVRSRISQCDVGEIIREFLQRSDLSTQLYSAGESVRAMAYGIEEEHKRPSVLYRPALSIDGNMWCALYGANLQEGVAGFGETPEKAMLDFDKNWRSAQCLTRPT